jgi:hypothetical protein
MMDTVPALKSRALRVIELEFAAPILAEPFTAVRGVRGPRWAAGRSAHRRDLLGDRPLPGCVYARYR